MNKRNALLRELIFANTKQKSLRAFKQIERFVSEMLWTHLIGPCSQVMVLARSSRFLDTAQRKLVRNLRLRYLVIVSERQLFLDDEYE